jgi:DNA primase
MSTVDDIKQKLDIVDVVSQYGVKLNKSGKNLKANCPFHAEKTPSFFVFPEKQSWHCFGACGTGGDVFGFVMRKEGIEFGDALRLLAEKAGVTLTSHSRQDAKEDLERHERLYKANEVAAEYFHYLLLHSGEAETARQYAEKRGMSAKTITDFQLGFALNKWDGLIAHLTKAGYSQEEMLSAGLIVPREKADGYYDRFRNRLIFPIRNIKGKVVGFGGRALDDSLPKYLNSPQTPIFDKSSIVYAIDRAQPVIRQKDFVVITEGYMDTITAHQYSFENTVACMGTALTQKQLDSIGRLTKHIIIALDADLAGREAVGRSGELIQTIFSDADNSYGYVTYAEAKGLESKVAVIGENAKDPDELIRKDPELWASTLRDAKPIIEFIFDSAIAKIDLANAQDKSNVVESLSNLIFAINNQVKKAHYIHQLSQKLGLPINSIETELHKMLQTKKKKFVALQKQIKRPEVKTNESKHFEEHCLALLLGYPDLREKGTAIPPEYFDHPTNRYIFLKWQEDPTVLLEQIDPTVSEEMASLLNRKFPLSLTQNESARESELHGCINRLQEMNAKNLELIKELVLDEEREKGTPESQLAKLQSHGIEPSENLKGIFRDRPGVFNHKKGD